MTINESVQSQFDRAWKMVEASIGDIPEPEWRSAGSGHVCPARLAYHIVETVEYYIADTDAFPFGHRFGGDWEELPADELPPKNDVVQYLGEVQQKLQAWLATLDDESIRGPNRRHPWCGKTVLELALYVLRHTMHHHGELNALSILQGLSGDNWE